MIGKIDLLEESGVAEMCRDIGLGVELLAGFGWEIVVLTVVAQSCSPSVFGIAEWNAEDVVVAWCLDIGLGVELLVCGHAVFPTVVVPSPSVADIVEWNAAGVVEECLDIDLGIELLGFGQVVVLAVVVSLLGFSSVAATVEWNAEGELVEDCLGICLEVLLLAG